MRARAAALLDEASDDESNEDLNEDGSADEDVTAEASAEDSDGDAIGAAAEAAGQPTKIKNVSWIKKDKVFIAKRKSSEAGRTWEYKRFRCIMPENPRILDASRASAAAWATAQL